ncbi:MAG: hypothetical protein ACTSRS_12695 [Candidatus Helarchaeota archaeon]
MQDVSGLWVIDKEGHLLLTYEFYPQGSGEFNSALFSGLIISIQQLSKELGEKKTERIEMGNSKYFILKDSETEISFIIRTSKSVNNKKAAKLLNKIQTRFLKKFRKIIPQLNLKDLRTHIMMHFQIDVSEFFEDFTLSAKDRVKEFFEKV